MRERRRTRPRAAAAALLAALVLVVLGAAGAAHAAPNYRVGIADDAILLFGQDRAPDVVQQWKDAGIDAVRVQVRWVALAPDPMSPVPPLGFDASDPDDPGYHWDILDRAIALLRDAGIQPLLSVTGSGPLWSSRVPSLGRPRYKPDPVKFGQFATAVARRYGRLGVHTYLIWNEPNQPLWLQPQQQCAPGARRCSPVAPHLYRELFRAAYAGIHGADQRAQVIAGTLAPRGADPQKVNRPLRPLAFLRALGCEDERFRPVRTGLCRGFRPITVDGFAYHPHSIKASPATPSPHTDDADFADLPKLEATLDALQGTGALLNRRAGRPIDLWLTEFGYQTSPPDPYDGIPPARQSRWLQQAAYGAWKDPRIKALVQYEWQDEAVRSVGTGRKRFAGWQSGLLDVDGRPKPALAGFLHPFYADTAIAAPRVRFWGQVRPGTLHGVLLQRRSPSGAWVTIARLRTDAHGSFDVTLAVKGPGAYRYRTNDPPPAAVWRSDVLSVRPLAARPLQAPAPPATGPCAPASTPATGGLPGATARGPARCP